MSAPTVTVTPELFHETLLAYCGSKCLMSAVELDLFTVLARTAGSGLTEAEIQLELRLHPRLSHDFLETLVALGLLVTEGDRYLNSPVAAVYLDREKASYIGGFAETTNDTFYPAWGKLTKALRTGQAQTPIPPDDDKHLFRVDSTTEPDRVRRFMSAMDTHSTRMASELAQLVDWSQYATFADLGGARGNFACHLITAQPHLTGTCYDRPQSEPFFNEHVASFGLSNQVSFEAGDFFADELPHVDALVIGHVLHDWSPANRQMLINNAMRAVNPGGIVIIYDRMTDGSPKDLSRLFYSMTFMLASNGGSEYSVEQCQQWLRDAGASRVEAFPVLNDHNIVIGHRAGK